MMRDLESLFPNIKARAQAAPDPTVLAAVRDALTELCDRCRVWCVDDVFPLTDGPTVVFASADTVVIEFDSVTFDGRPLDPKTLGDMARWQRHWRDAQGVPRFYAQDRPNELIVAPHQPGQEIALRVFVKPGAHLDAAPAQILDMYRLELIDGALSKLLGLLNEPFSNPQLAVYHAGRWEDALAHRATDYLKGQQQAPLRSSPNYF